MRLRIVLGVVALGAVLGCGGPKDDRPNVILISLDTLGAKHLGCYGYDRDTSPNLDRFAESAVLFENAYSTAPKTPESHMSMFTSLFPSVHRVFTIMKASRIHVLHPGVETVAELLSRNGYETVGYHNGGFVDGKFGFDRGFDEYALAPDSIATAADWIADRDRGSPFFLFVHTYHVHDPYTPGPPYDTRFVEGYDGAIVHDRRILAKDSSAPGWGGLAEEFWKHVDRDDPRDVEHLIALYDGAIAELDDQLARLFEAIDRHAPNSLVVVVSDHGEEFGQHGQFLHNQLYDEILHVPLIIRRPGTSEGRRVSRTVSLIDLAPTILDEVGIASPPGFQGTSLDLDHAGTLAAAPVYGEYPGGRLSAVVEERFKLLRTGEGEEVYDLERDPGERDDLAATSPRRPRLAARMDEIHDVNVRLSERINHEPSEGELDEETLRQLESLGYID